jgi:hypothetical protein
MGAEIQYTRRQVRAILQYDRETKGMLDLEAIICRLKVSGEWPL